MDPEIRVTRINGRWHARLIFGEKVWNEMACENQNDIGWICREMLRWFDKMGGGSKFAAAARKRQVSGPLARIWYRNALEAERS